MHRPVDLALAQQVDDASIGRAVQAVAHFHGRAPAAAALAALVAGREGAP